jgi:hypothetical protein
MADDPDGAAARRVVQQRAQLLAAAGDARHQRTGGYAQHVGGLGIGKALDGDHDKRGAPVGTDRLQRVDDLARGDAVDLLGGRGQRLARLQRQHGGFAATVRLAHLVDEQVVHDREQPPPGAFSGLPVIETDQRPLQAVLDEVVGGVAVAQQRARIAAQARNFTEDRCLLLVHDRGSQTAPVGPAD